MTEPISDAEALVLVTRIRRVGEILAAEGPLTAAELLDRLGCSPRLALDAFLGQFAAGRIAFAGYAPGGAALLALVGGER